MLMSRLPRGELRAELVQLREFDWDFATSASQSSFSSVHWHPCRFPSQVPAVVIGALTKPGDTVLDPFVGSGTTAVEAQRLSRRCIAIELNPVAVNLTRSKTRSESASSIQSTIAAIRLGARRSDILADVPSTVQSGKWYTRKVLRDLRKLWGYVGTLAGTKRTIAKAAFSAILLPVCRETRHWGYVCDNTAPKEDYERDVLDTFEHVLDVYEKAYLERDEYWRRDKSYPAAYRKVHVFEGDARKVAARLKRGSVDLIVTSPPYSGVADYIKAQRLTLEWLGCEIEPNRLMEIGARSKRHRPTATCDYVRECGEAFGLCRRLLKPGKPCVILFGESDKRAPILEQFIETIEAQGFKLEENIIRQISTRRRFAPSVLTERLLVFA